MNNFPSHAFPINYQVDDNWYASVGALLESSLLLRRDSSMQTSVKVELFLGPLGRGGAAINKQSRETSKDSLGAHQARH